MKEIGSQLKEAREQKKLSIHDVSIATKINNKILQAIEDGDEDNLPAKPFLRGFIQSYARYLELDVNSIMKQFLETVGSTKPKPQITEGESPEQVDHEEVQSKFEMYKKAAYGVAAIVAIFLIYFIQQVVSKYEQESKVAKEQQEAVKSQTLGNEEESEVTENAPEDVNEETPAETKEAVAEKKPEEKIEAPAVTQATKLTPAPAPVPAPAATASPPTPLVVAPPTPVPAPAPKPATPAPSAATTPATTTPAAPVPPAPKPEEKKPASRPQQIIIEALDNVEVRYSKDGESERTVKLKPEQYLTIKADSKINLNVSDSGAVNIIHNGRDKGVPGNLGQPRKISYP